ncbi:MAG: hypothetical protein ACTSRA_10765 [Promethearchaeota archaeon]
MTGQKRKIILFLVLFSLFLFHALDTRIKKVKGYAHELIYLSINGIENPSLVQAHLGENITVNATWNFYFDPSMDNGSVCFYLKNNNSEVAKSVIFTEPGININHVWTFYLDPKDWSCSNNQSEFGRVIINFRLFGYMNYNKNYTYPLEVSPFDVNFTYQGKYMKNETSTDRMEYLNLTYKIQCLQDPSYVLEDLSINYEIIDQSNEVIFNSSTKTDPFNIFNVHITKPYLLDLESYKLRIFNAPELKTGIKIKEYNLSLYVNRSHIFMGFVNADEIIVNNTKAVNINFSFATDCSDPLIQLLDLYYICNITLPGSPDLVCNLSGTIKITENISVLVEQSHFDKLDNLSCHIFFEGNFMIRSATFKIESKSFLDRDLARISFVNYDFLLNYTNFSSIPTFEFQITTNNSILLNHTQTVEYNWTHLTDDNKSFINKIETDLNGSFSIKLNQVILDDLERYILNLTVMPSIEVKRTPKFYELYKIFQRFDIKIEFIKNITAEMVYNVSDLNLYFNITEENDDNNSTFLKDIPVNLDLLDANNQTLFNLKTLSDSNGSVNITIERDYFKHGGNFTVRISINSTLLFKGSSVCLNFSVIVQNSTSDHYTETINEFNKNRLLTSLILICGFTATPLSVYACKKNLRKYIPKKKFKVKVRI